MMDRSVNNLQKPLMRSRALAAGAIALLLAVANTAVAGTVSLRSQADIDSDLIRLSDVAELSGDVAAGLGQAIVTTLNPDEPYATITLRQVREILTEQGVNWGKLKLGGYAACFVKRSRARTDTIAAQQTPAVSNPQDEIDLGSAISLHDQVVQLIERFAGVEHSQLRIQFNQQDEQSLAKSALDDRFEFEPLSATPLGRVPVVIRRYRGNQLVETIRVTADVSRRTMAVVAKRTVSRGQTFAPGDVEIREVYMENSDTHPLDDLTQVIGQTCGTVLRAGMMVSKRHLRSPLMVRRGELITVRCISGELVIKTIGRAAEDGELNQTIEVRNDHSRETYAVRVMGRQEGVAVLAGEPSDASMTAGATPQGRQP